MKLLASTSIYTVTSLLNAAIPFLLLPLLTTYLSPADYGIMSVITTVISIVFPFTIMGIGSAIYIEYFKLEPDEFPGYASSVMVIPLICTLINLLLFLPSGNLLYRHLAIPPGWAILIPLLILLQIVPYLVSIFYQVRREPLAYSKYQTSLTIVNLSCSVAFVVFFKMGWEGRLMGMYLAYGVFSLVGIYLIYRLGYLVKTFRLKYVKSALLIGIPLIPHEIGTIIVNMSDRLFITNMVGVEAVGLYSIGYQVGTLVYILVTSFNQAWTPHLFNILREASTAQKQQIVRQSYLFMVVIVVSFLMLWMVTPFLFRIFINARFSLASDFVFWIGLGHVFFGMYIMVVSYIYYQKKTYLLTYLTCGAGLVNLLLNYLLIQRYGAIGAAYATAISYFSFFVVAWWLSNKIYPMPWFSFYKKCEVGGNLK